MPSLVTRFHLLIFFVTIAIGGVALIHVPEGYVFPAHWQRGGADWLWPRDIALAVAPIIQVVMMAAFFALGHLLTRNHLSKTRHIFDPALTLLLTVPAACQFGLLMLGVGSDFDMFRITAFGLAALLLVVAIVVFEAERHSYGGLRMPWPIPSDRAWRIVHRLSGLCCGVSAIALAWLAWSNADPGPLVFTMAAILVGLPLLAGLFTLLFRAIR